jgi:hypothetical protein
MNGFAISYRPAIPPDKHATTGGTLLSKLSEKSQSPDGTDLWLVDFGQKANTADVGKLIQKLSQHQNGQNLDMSWWEQISK